MAVKRREVVKYFVDNGFYLLREGKKHSIYTNNARIVPIKRHRTIDRIISPQTNCANRLGFPLGPGAFIVAANIADPAARRVCKTHLAETANRLEPDRSPGGAALLADAAAAGVLRWAGPRDKTGACWALPNETRFTPGE